MNDRTVRMTIGVAALGAALGAGPAFAQAPALLPVHGVLTNMGGERIVTPVNVTFSLYTDMTGGTAFHREVQAVAPDNGVFTAYLGTDQSLDLSSFTTEEIYLGVEVEADGEMEPRIRLGTAAYAAFAQFCGEASVLDGLEASDFARDVHTHDWDEVSNVPADIADGDAVLDQATVEGYARGVCYDAPGEVTQALPNLDTDARDDLTTATRFGGDVAGPASNLQLVARSVGTTEIAAGAVTRGAIATDAVGAQQIASGAVTSSALASSAVDADAIATGAVGSAEIDNGSVASVDLATGAVTETRLANGAVTRTKLARNAAGLDEVQLPVSSGGTSQLGNFRAGVNYLFASTPVTTAASGAECLVVASASIANGSNGDSGTMAVTPASRVGILGVPRRIGLSSAGIVSVIGTARANASSSEVTSLSPNQATFFGCAIELNGSSLLNNSLACKVSWICS